MRADEGKYIFIVTHGDVITFIRKMNPLTLLFGEDEAHDTARATLYQFTI
jgi:hypothetical protein